MSVALAVLIAGAPTNGPALSAANTAYLAEVNANGNQTEDARTLSAVVFDKIGLCEQEIEDLEDE